MIDPYHVADVPNDMRPQLVVVVDTEAEFDWTAEPDKNATEVTAIRNIHLVQEIFDEYGIKPCYVVDFPMASSAESVDILRSYFVSGRCEIGAHLHPWVNPPFRESLSRSNMYPGNLGFEIEHEKLALLTTRIEEAFGERPVVYKAGRYGVGAETVRVLESLGYEIDLSICPPFDFSDDGGRDFSAFDARPHWICENSSMLEIPLTGAFVGTAGKLSAPLYRIAGNLDALRLRGVFARLGLVDRLLLSPEGHTHAEHRKLVHYLLRRGVRTFTWSFHSPSVYPGMTMYTRNDRELQEFLDSFQRFFDFFLGELNGVATTPLGLKKLLLEK